VKVRTHIAMNGYNSGVVLDLPDDEAASLIAQNFATAAVDDTAAVIESATIEAPENAAAPKPRARKAPARKAEQ
jgi:hypothetical protein